MIRLTNTQDVGRQVLDPADFEDYEHVLMAVERRIQKAFSDRRAGHQVDMMGVNNGARRDIANADAYFNAESDVRLINTLAAAATQADIFSRVKARSESQAKALNMLRQDRFGRFPYPSQYIAFRNFLADNPDILDAAAQAAGIE